MPWIQWYRVENENAHPKVSIHASRFRGRCTWENQIRRFRNRQNLVVIAILGCGADLVKGKNLACDYLHTMLNTRDLQHNEEVGRLWKNCCYSDQSVVRFPSKGAERLGLLIADPQ
jgi:hypothetical protein